MKKEKFLYGVIAFIIIIIIYCFYSKEAQADTINLNYVSNQYDLSFPANVIFDDYSSGYSFSYAFEIDPTWKIHFGYADLGQAEQLFLFIPTKLETTALSIILDGSLVVGNIANHDIRLHGLIGAIRADMDATVGFTSLSDRDTGLVVGLGSSIWLSAYDAISLNYKKANLVFSNGVTFDYDPTMLEIGYTRRF